MEKDIKSQSAGIAYGFFQCQAKKEEIETLLPTICKAVKTPSTLELSLTEGMDNIKGDNRLTALAQEAKQDGINYMLQATYSNRSNKESADELSAIINQAYQSPLYQENEPFSGAIVYEEAGEYIFRD